VDGAEWAHRFDSQNEVGVSLGHVPEVQGELDLDNQSQGAIFYRHISSLRQPLDWRVGFQKTWQGKQEDRELWVLDAGYRGTEGSSYSGTLWLDNYDNKDTPKDSGAELTRLFLNTRQPFGDHGQWGLSYSEFRFPKTLKTPLVSLPMDDLFEDETRRVGVDLWGRWASDLRYRGRIDRWWATGEHSAQGLSGNIGLTLEQVNASNMNVDVALFASHGSNTDHGTLRVNLRSLRAPAYWTIGAELAGSSAHPPDSPRSTTWQPQAHASVNLQPANNWSLTLDAFAGWGDLGKTLNLSAHLVWSF
jgi:hypothetical protein